MAGKVSKDMCYGDVEAFAKDMIKIINAKEFRLVQLVLSGSIVYCLPIPDPAWYRPLEDTVRKKPESLPLIPYDYPHIIIYLQAKYFA